MRRLTPTLGIVAWSVLAGVTLAEPADTAADGNLLMGRVLATVERHVTVTARLRYQARLAEHTLVGSGRYWQQGANNRPLTRWEMQTQIADKTASFVQVFDGTHLWTDRRLPSGRRVHRLDLPRLHAQLRTAGWGTPPVGSLQQMLLAAQGRGGLAQMLADLAIQFNFGPPRPTQLNGLPVDALVGQWRIDQLRRVWPEVDKLGSEDRPHWPEQLPHHVLVLVGKNLFPYVIEHRRADDAILANSAAGLRPTRDPLLRYELFEVNFAAALDRSMFQFKDDVDWKDETSLVVERLRKPQPSQTAARPDGETGKR